MQSQAQARRAQQGRTASLVVGGGAGGSEGRSRCDEQLFTVLQEQHNRGLLRAAGTEDLFRNVSRRQRASGKRPPVAATDAAATTAAAATAAAPGAAQVADQGSEGTAVDMSAESGMAGAGCASAAAPAEAAAWPADGAGPAPASATQVRASADPIPTWSGVVCPGACVCCVTWFGPMEDPSVSAAACGRAGSVRCLIVGACLADAVGGSMQGVMHVSAARYCHACARACSTGCVRQSLGGHQLYGARQHSCVSPGLHDQRGRVACAV